MEDKEVRYSPRMVAYVDVLGFRNMVRESEQDPSSIHGIWGILQATRDQVMQMNSVGHDSQHEPPPLELQSVMFSDTVVMTQSICEHSRAAALLEWVSILQTTLLERGVFVRGAVALGEMYVDGNLMFGPALLKAYDAESLAVWPRVVIDPSVLEVEAATKWLQHFGTRDNDGLLYVDYLRSTLVTEIAIEVEVALRSGQVTRQHLTEPIARRYFGEHAEGIVRSVLSLDWESDGKTVQKYHWLAEYHNSAIDDLRLAASGEGESHSRYSDSVAWDLSRGSKAYVASRTRVDDELRRTYESVRDLRLDLRACFPRLYR